MRGFIWRGFIVMVATLFAVACSDDGSGGALEQDATGDVQGDADDSSSAESPGWLVERGDACGDGVCEGSESEDSCPEDCAEAPVARMDPFSDDLDFYPHDLFTVEDSSTATGLRVDITQERFPKLGRYTRTALSVLKDLVTLDGFGWIAGGYIRFDRSVAADTVLAADGETPSEAGPNVIAGYIDADGAFVRQPIEVQLPSDGKAIVFRPMFPLPPASHAVFALTTSITDTAGRPLMPSPWMQAALDGEAPAPLDRVQGRFDESVAALIGAGVIEDGSELAALLPFTTQSLDPIDAEVREDLRERTIDWVSEGCQTLSSYRRCNVTLSLPNYRGGDHRSINRPGSGRVGTYDVPMVAYLPLLEVGDDEGVQAFQPPYRTIIGGHGLAGTRNQISMFAARATAMGLALVAIDAPEHGDHPSRTDPSPDSQSGAINFLGFRDGSYDAIFMRDNWRQAVWDKLGLLQALRQGLDIDGNGEVDLTTDQLCYFGASLGTIMAPQFIAWADEVEVAVLTIGGARLGDIMQFSRQFANLFKVLVGPGLKPHFIETLYPVLQTILEQGDPALYSAHLGEERLIDAPPVQIIKGMAFNDEIVPDEANVLMARVMNLTQVPPVLKPVGHIEVAEGRSLSGNMESGGTAAYIQFDYVQSGDGWRLTDHSRLPGSPVGIEAWFHFLETFYEDGVGEVIDPYERFGYTRP